MSYFDFHILCSAGVRVALVLKVGKSIFREQMVYLIAGCLSTLQAVIY